MIEKAQNIAHYEKSFGAVAVNKGYLNKDELVHALATQVEEEIEEGIHRLLGEILLDRNIMSVKQIEEVLKVVIAE